MCVSNVGQVDKVVIDINQVNEDLQLKADANAKNFTQEGKQNIFTLGIPDETTRQQIDSPQFPYTCPYDMYFQWNIDSPANQNSNVSVNGQVVYQVNNPTTTSWPLLVQGFAKKGDVLTINTTCSIGFIYKIKGEI